MSLIPGLDEIVKIANNFIPDKNTQYELEKKALEVNEEINKSNQKLLGRVIPLTFPIATWVFLFIPLSGYLTSLVKYWFTGKFFEIPLPSEFLGYLFKVVMVFICALAGKWNIREYFDKK